MGLYNYLVRKFHGLPEESAELIAAKNYESPPICYSCFLKGPDLHVGYKPSKIDFVDSNELAKEAEKIYEKFKIDTKVYDDRNHL